MQLLCEMGYDEADVRIALKVTNNRAEDAITYLLTNPLPLS